MTGVIEKKNMPVEGQYKRDMNKVLSINRHTGAHIQKKNGPCSDIHQKTHSLIDLPAACKSKTVKNKTF
jgi:hypothetical protein